MKDASPHYYPSYFDTPIELRDLGEVEAPAPRSGGVQNPAHELLATVSDTYPSPQTAVIPGSTYAISRPKLPLFRSCTTF